MEQILIIITIVIIISGIVLLIDFVFNEPQESNNAVAPKTKLIEFDCTDQEITDSRISFKGVDNKTQTCQMCVGYNDVSTYYPMEHCENEYSIIIGGSN